MDSLSEAYLAYDQPYRMDRVNAAELGPYPRAYRFSVRAYAFHTGGDGSSASLKLDFNGAEVGDQTDDNGGFSETTLQAEYAFYLSAGSTAEVKLTNNNNKATLQDFGFDFWWE